MFSLAHGTLLTPPPYPQPENVVLVRPAKKDGRPAGSGATTGQWLEWQKGTKSFEAIAIYDWTFDFLMQPDRSQSVQGLSVTPEYFKVVGVNPLMGRVFATPDTPAPRMPVTSVILGYNIWREQFAGDPQIIGKAVKLSRRPPLTVVGVMPPGVRFLPSPGNASEPNYNLNGAVGYWIPRGPPDPARPKQYYGEVVARLRVGTTLAQGQAELKAIAARMAQENPDLEGMSAEAIPLIAELNHDGERLLLPLLGAVALVFLIACGNVAGLLLTRGLQRQQEYVVRCALGAQRGQLFRQVLTESLLLAVLGGALGVGLAVAIVKVMTAIGGHAIPRLDAVTLGWPALGFCTVAAVLAALLAGLAPALHAARLNPSDGLKGTRTSSAGRTERRVLGGVSILQTALTLALLVGAGLLVRTVGNLARVRPGYEIENVLTMSVTMPDNNKSTDFHIRALEQVAKVPGVNHVAFGWGLPLTGNHWGIRAKIEGLADSDKLKDAIELPLRSVTPDYFDALGIKIVAGRGFQMTDGGPGASRDAPRVLIVNEALAKKFFGDAPAVGRKMVFPGAIDKPIEIIGVLADVQNTSLAAKAEPEAYVSFWQFGAFSKHLVVRTAGDPRAVGAAVLRALREVDPIVAVEQTKPLAQIRDDSVAAQTFAMRLLVGFSVVGSILALIGIYGVLALSVGARTREIAVRIAMGAERRSILALVLGSGLKLIATGLLIGTGVALALGKVLRSYLFGIEPTDPVTFVVVALLFTGVALLACYLPARRAAAVDPMVALRNE
jgi:putative ABC transport system permease protein